MASASTIGCGGVIAAEGSGQSDGTESDTVRAPGVGATTAPGVEQAPSQCAPLSPPSLGVDLVERAPPFAPPTGGVLAVGHYILTAAESRATVDPPEQLRHAFDIGEGGTFVSAYVLPDRPNRETATFYGKFGTDNTEFVLRGPSCWSDDRLSPLGALSDGTIHYSSDPETIVFTGGPRRYTFSRIW